MRVWAIFGVAVTTAMTAVGAQHSKALSKADPWPETVAAVDAHFETTWAQGETSVAPPAAPLTVLRRLSLALHGTVPSLEEIRQFEADPAPGRLQRWVARMLADPRFARYFAERWARALVGTERTPVVIFRRDRFVAWLRDELARNRPYDEIVRSIIASEGLWTARPAVNFVSRARVDGRVDGAALAGRTARVFLGQRIDCAQCHDHPYDDWTQAQFEGLAGFFAEARVDVSGVHDRVRSATVTARVPFGQAWATATATRRRRLAAWVTHPDNRRFARATANRVWGLMFGRPWRAPVDDLEDPGPDADVLDILGRGFVDGGYDLRRLIATVAATKAFGRSSRGPPVGETEPTWAVFPLARLRPEQVVGSLLQAASLRTIDRESPGWVRAVRWLRERDFVHEYGDLGGDELQVRPGTIAQALLRLNGRMFQELITAGPWSSTGRLAALAEDDLGCLEATYLTFLSRRPTPAERAHFLPPLAGTSGRIRGQRVEDIAWALANAPEFSWNH